MTESLPSAGNNPYVGPRPFQIAETLFGREREITELDHLLSAERIVLLYSPSGAGKSSLINAGLIPRLDWYWALTRNQPTAGRFDCWPPTRVNHPLPTDFKVKNRYAWSAAMGLEQEVPDEFRRSPQALANLSLKDAVAGRRRRRGAPTEVLLIFDQFEEFLRTDTLGVPEKEAFFDQLGELLYDPQIWALFVLREDYLAAIDPYCRRLPTHLTHRYRIDRLSREAAAEAMEGPTRNTARKFAPGVVAQLVQDLAQVQVQQPDGTFVTQTGLHVEPMHLQVVCVGLWDRMAPEDLLIDMDDVTTFGDVGQALANYYESSVAGVAAGDTGEERRIRDWFEDRLITPDGVRRQVLLGVEQSEGLLNSQIERLKDTYLVRAEQRASATWFELAHDRLIQPIRNSNADWRDSHLSDFQRAAILWERSDRSDALQLRDAALDKAEAWAGAHDAELTRVEREFLEACGETRVQAQRERQSQRNHRLLRAGIAVLVLVTVGMLTTFHYYLNARDERERAVRAETLARLGALAALDFGPQPQLGLLLAVQHARMITRGIAPELGSSTRELIRQGLSTIGGIPLGSQDVAGHAVAFSPDGQRIATSGGADIWLWAAATPGAAPVVLRGGPAALTRLAFSPDGARLASGAADGGVQLWTLGDAGGAGVARVLSGHSVNSENSKSITDLAFSTDGRWLASASYDGTVRLWEVTGERVFFRKQGGQAITTVAFSPDGRQMAAGGGASDDDHVFAVYLWDLTSADPLAAPAMLDNEDQVNRLTYSPDGRWLAAGRGETSGMALWDLTNGKRRCLTPAVNQWSSVIAFSPDSRWMATPSQDRVLVWDLARPTPCESLLTLTGHQSLIQDLAFSGDGQNLATASLDGTARVWSMENLYAAPAVLRGHEGSLYALAFSPDSQSLVTAGADRMPRLWRAPLAGAEPTMLFGAAHPGEIQLWPMAGGEVAAEPQAVGTAGQTSWAAFSPDGRWLASYDDSDLVELRRTDDLAAQPLGLHHSNVQLMATPTFSPDGRWLATGDHSGIIRLWDLGAARPDAAPRRWPTEWGPIRELAFSPDGQRLISASNNWTAAVWEVTAPDPAAAPLVLPGHSNVVRTVALSPDRRWALTGDWDAKARLWDLTTPDPAAHPRLLQFGDRLFSVAFSPDGRWAVAGSLDGTALLIDLGAAESTPMVLRHGAKVLSVTFSPDSRWLASGSEDLNVRLWDLAAKNPGGEPVVLNVGLKVGTISFSPDGRWLSAQVNEHRAQPFSPDGRLVATFGNERRLFHMRTDDLITLACRTAGRNMTRDEWLQLLTDEPYQATCPALPKPVTPGKAEDARLSSHP